MLQDCSQDSIRVYNELNKRSGQTLKNNAISRKIPTHIKKWFKMKILQKIIKIVRIKPISSICIDFKTFSAAVPRQTFRSLLKMSKQR